MNKSHSIVWFEWFTKQKEQVFEFDTKNIWGLALRNGIAPTIFKKWLREEICKEITDHSFDIKEIQSIENQWVNQKKITTEKFSRSRALILARCRMSEENFSQYCINELKAIKWAQEKWSRNVEQIYLETKDKYDEVKLQMITIPLIEKGLTLEIYQQLKEEEIDFSEVGTINSVISYQSQPEGTWYKRTNLRKEIYQIISSMNQGNLSAPSRINNSYTIIKLCETRGTKLSEEIRNRIINEQMNSFIDYGVEKLLDHSSM